MASPAAKALIALHERERRKIEIVGERVINRIAPQINAKLLTAFERGGDVLAVVNGQLDELYTPLVMKAMLAGHLEGKLRSARQAAVALRKRKSMAAYDDALKYLQKRLALTDEQMAALMEQYGNEAVKITRGLAAETEKAVARAMQEILDKGMHVKQGVATLRRELVTAGTGPLSPGLMNTFVRTQTAMAYSAGRWNGDQDEAIQEILWGYEYVAQMDGRTRPTHQAMHGVRAAKDDPLWKTWWPPAGFQCRCTTLEIMREEKIANPKPPPDRFTADDGTVIRNPQPDDGWAFNPGEVFREAA